MDLSLLETFEAAARLGSFRGASRELHLSQPSVTKHIQQLEAELGVRLFEREGRRVRLNPAGERFLRHVRVVLAAYQAGVEELVAYRRGYQSRLAVAASPAVAREPLPSLIGEFADLRPEVEITLRVVESEEVEAAVAEGGFDLGLGRVPGHDSRVTTERLCDDPVRLIAPGHRGGVAAPLPPWETLLQSERLLTHNHPGYWEALLTELRHRNLQLRTLAITQLDITKRMIEEGLGISFLPLSVVRREIAEGRLVDVPTPGLSLPMAATYLLLPVSRPIPPPAWLFAEVVRERLAPAVVAGGGQEAGAGERRAGGQ